MNKSFMLRFGGKKPLKVSEGVLLTDIEASKADSVQSLVLTGKTFCTYRQGYPNNSSTFHLGSVYPNYSGYYIRLRERGQTFMDADEFERLVRACSPTLIDERSADGRITVKSFSGMPSFFIDPLFMRSKYVEYTIFLDIAPETELTTSTLYTNMAFYHQNRSYIELLSTPNGTEEVSIIKSSSGNSLYGIKNTSKYKTQNRFFIRPETFCIVEGRTTERPTSLPPTNGKDHMIPVNEPLKAVVGNDGTVYADEFNVTTGKIQRRVKSMTVTHQSDLELITPEDGGAIYFRVKLPTPIVNGAVDTNMFDTSKDKGDFSTDTNIGFVDEDGEYYCFKIYASTNNLKLLRSMLTSYPFEIYWYDGGTVLESVEPFKIHNLAGKRTFEVCSYVDAGIRIEHE